MHVLLPQRTFSQIGLRSEAPAGTHPTLFLLHGLSDDHTAWTRRTSIERYVSPLGLAVVMPNVHKSYYTDMACGDRYWTFISEELPRIARSFFPLSSDREDNFVAGLSMGGYGAMKLAMRLPDRFAAGASLSGALDTVAAYRTGRTDFPPIFGSFEQLRGSDDDLFAVAARLAGGDEPKPLLYQCCGTEDEHYGQNARFRDECRSLGLPLTYEEEPGGHDWSYWDRKIQRVLEWLPLRNRPLEAKDSGGV